MADSIHPELNTILNNIESEKQSIETQIQENTTALDEIITSKNDDYSIYKEDVFITPQINNSNYLVSDDSKDDSISKNYLYNQEIKKDDNSNLKDLIDIEYKEFQKKNIQLEKLKKKLKKIENHYNDTEASLKIDSKNVESNLIIVIIWTIIFITLIIFTIRGIITKNIPTFIILLSFVILFIIIFNIVNNLYNYFF